MPSSLQPRLAPAYLIISFLALLSGFIFLTTNRTAEASRSQDNATNRKAAATQPDQATREHISSVYGKLPLSFEANHGQADTSVKFISRGSGYQLFLTGNEAVLALNRGVASRQTADVRLKEKAGEAEADAATESAVLRLKLAGARQNPQVVGLDQLPGKINYFIGSNQKDWRTDIPTFARVEYSEVYPGVNVVYYGNQQQLEYDFVLAPGANPAQIKLAFTGAERIEIDAQGDLILRTPGGDVRQLKPLVYQETDGVRQEIPSRYVLTSENEIGFDLAAYDRTKPLVIDPVLAYSTFLGGTSTDQALAIAVDAAGQAHVTGFTLSTNFPTASPLQGTLNGVGVSDVFVTKLNATGSALVYSTYLGGNATDRAQSIAVDAAGNAYLTGNTFSPDFPVANAWQPALRGASDIFVTKLNPAGSALVYSTYAGGSSGDQAYDIALDAAGNSYLAGYTSSIDFPTVAPFQANRQGNTFFKSSNAGGQWNAADTGLVAAQISSLVIHPTNSSIIYATTETGVFISTDDGNSWAGAGRDQLNTFVYDLAIDPTNPSTLYVATTGSGIYKSTNGGSNWTQINMGLSVTQMLSVAINPNSPNIVYAGTRTGGIFRSVDGGANWVASSTGIPVNTSVYTILMPDPANPLYMYIGTSRGVYRSDNGGFANWVGPANLTNTIIYDIAIDRITPTTFYAATSFGLYKSVNSGVNWTFIPSATNLTTQAIVIDPANPLTMYLATTGTGVLKTMDGGATWVRMDNGFPNSTVYALALKPLSTFTVYAGAFSGSDAFLMKLNAAGTSAVYSTYLGGTLSDHVNGIAVDSQGNAYLAGQTESANFPLVNALQSVNSGRIGGFVAKFNAAGSAPVYSTYLGGADDDIATGIAVDSSGNANVVGMTYSADFPTANALQPACESCLDFTPDAFISKLNPSGSAFVYSTYLGGTDADVATGIAVDAAGNAVAAGFTYSFNFPSVDPAQATHGGFVDGFVTKLGAGGAPIIYSTYLGGNSQEQINGIAVDASNNAYVAGHTTSLNYPTVNPFQSVYRGNTDAFVAKLGIVVDLSISKLDSRDPVMVNSNFSYSITATNHGPSAATGVTVTDALPAGLTFISAFSTQGTCSGTTTVTCSIGSLAANGSAVVTITVKPTVVGPISNTATVAGNEPEQNAANNSATQSTNISSQPSITGRVVDAGNNGLSGVTVTLSGTQSSAVQTGANGNYQFNNLTTGGTFTVTPSKPSYTFTPPSQSFNNLQQDQTANFGSMVCAYSISPAGQSIASGGGNGSINVTATGDCPWTATSDASWITITSGASGNGNGTVTFSVSPTTAPRSGAVTVAGQTFIVWQEFSSCATPSFRGVRNYQLFDTPNSMSSADFNNDGKKDIVTLATGHSGSGLSVNVVLNNGAGGFGPATAYQTSSGTPMHLTVAQVNTTDGNVDLIVTDGFSVQVMFGNGAGAFGSTIMFTVGTHFHYSTVPADFNNDGKTDLAVWYEGGSNNNAVSILLGNGLGGFGSPVATFDGMSPSVGDFNRDNKPDIAVINGANLSVRFGGGAGNFGAPVNTAMSNVNRPQFHDINGDGKLDFLNETYIAFGNGAGGFGVPIPFSFGPQQTRKVVAGDFDGDAKTDLVGIVGESDLVILRGDGLGNFGQPTSYVVGRDLRSLVAADFDNDNKLDVAAGIYFGSSVGVLFNYCGSDPGINIGGQVTSNSGILVSNATVRLVSSQLGTITRTTDTGGNYSFDNLPRNDTYTISVDQLGSLNFTPQTVVNPQVNQTVNFMSGPPAHLVSGRIIKGWNSQPMVGVTVYLTGHVTATAVTDSSGKFSFGLLPAQQSYAVTVLETPIYTYNVTTINIPLLNQERSLYFEAARRKFTLTALVQNSAGQPIGSVPVVLRGGAYRIAYTSGTNGTIAFTDLPAGEDYTLTPWNALYSLSPVSSSHTSLQSNVSVTFTFGPRRTSCDFDRDGKTDISVFRPSSGHWYISNSSDGSFRAEHFGASGDQLMPGDYDGDGHTDLAVFRPSNGYWYIIDSSTNTFRAQAWGQSGDIAASGDFDGDGVTDIAVFRPSSGAWYILRSFEGFLAQQFGTSGDVPVVGDYDFDGRKDIGVFRPSTGAWYIQQSAVGFLAQQFGSPGDQPVTGDFDGDNKADIAVFRPSNGAWYIQQSAAGFRAQIFGTNGDVAATGDYDGDAKADVAVFRPSNGSWYLLKSSNGDFVGQQFGLNGDRPAPAVYMP